MMQCEWLFGEKRGGEIQTLVESSTGEPCPCKQGLGCPLGDSMPAPAPEERPLLRLVECA